MRFLRVAAILMAALVTPVAFGADLPVTFDGVEHTGTPAAPRMSSEVEPGAESITPSGPARCAMVSFVRGSEPPEDER